MNLVDLNEPYSLMPSKRHVSRGWDWWNQIPTFRSLPCLLGVSKACSSTTISPQSSCPPAWLAVIQSTDGHSADPKDLFQPQQDKQHPPAGMEDVWNVMHHMWCTTCDALQCDAPMLSPHKGRVHTVTIIQVGLKGPMLLRFGLLLLCQQQQLQHRIEGTG